MRAQVEREIERLQRDFDKLPNIPCCVRIERSTIFSRYPVRRSVPTNTGPIRHFVAGGVGLEFPPVPVRSVEDLAKAVIFYDISGQPVCNSIGEPLLVDPGWRHSYSMEIEGPGPETEHVARTIERASDWAKSRWDILKPLLFPETLVLNNGSKLWIDVVAATAAKSESATLRHMNTHWVQTKPMHRVELKAWKNRHHFLLDEDTTIEDSIGDDPEDVFTETRSLIEDSFEVLDYLKRELPRNFRGDQETDQSLPVGDGDEADSAIAREALRAVVDGGLAGVLGAAKKAPSHVMVSKIMRNRCDEDSTHYWWSADAWVQELGCSKPTIIGNKRKGIPACDAWSEILAWRESNKQSRFAKKPKEKN